MLAPWQTLTWTWQATDNQEGDAPAGEYRVVLSGAGSAAASGSEDGGITPGTQTHTRISYYYFGSLRVALRQGEVGQGRDSVSWLHADHLGSLSEVTSATGGRIAQERYYPYGRVRWGSAPTSYNFTGQRLDQSTGLLFFQARYYDPRLARFVSADTMVPEPGNPQSLNRYSYTLNNPLRYTDPTGHWNEPCDPTCGGGNSSGGGSNGNGSSTSNSAYTYDLPYLGLDLFFGEPQDLGGIPCDNECFERAALEIPGFNSLYFCATNRCGEVLAYNLERGLWGLMLGRDLSVMPGVNMTVPASDILFTQDSIGAYTRLPKPGQPLRPGQGVPLDDLALDIDNGYFRGTLTVVEENGALWSINNRRLAAFKLLDHEAVPVTVYSANDPAWAATLNRYRTTPPSVAGSAIEIRGTGIAINWRGELISLDVFR